MLRRQRHDAPWPQRSLPLHRPLALCSDKMGIPLGTSLGKHCNTVLKLNNEALDVDVVVTSFLESNIHSLRHNYFHLNRCGPHAYNVPSAPQRADPYAGVIVIVSSVIMLVPLDRTVHVHQRCPSAAALCPNGPSLRFPSAAIFPARVSIPCNWRTTAHRDSSLWKPRNAGTPATASVLSLSASCVGSVFADVGTSASTAPCTCRPPARGRPEALHHRLQSLLPARGKVPAKTVVIALITAMITVVDLLGAGRW